MRYGATHRGFKSLPLRHASRPGRVPAVSSSRRARRGTSGALYLQSAPAGLNPLSRSPSSRADVRSGVEGRVPRSGGSRTASGPEGSSAKRHPSGAAVRPGLSRSGRWVRWRTDRRRVHGTSTHATCPQPRRRSVSTVAPHRAIYRRWRAQTFAQLIGQDAAVTTLRNAVRTGRLAHGLLFVGPARDRQDVRRPHRREGRQLPRASSTASRATPASPASPSARGPRSTSSRWTRRPTTASRTCATSCRASGRRRPTCAAKVFIVDEVQRIKDGWDVLLKTLEEPPDHVLFVFCTTDAGGVRPAVLSRLQRFDFTRISEDAIAGKLRMILAADGREADDEAVAILARLADGGMRDAESMLDQLLSGGPERLTADRVRDLLGPRRRGIGARGTSAALTDGDPLPGIVVLDALEERGRDLRAFLDQCVEALRHAIVAALGPPAGPRRRPPRRPAARRARRRGPAARGHRPGASRAVAGSASPWSSRSSAARRRPSAVGVAPDRSRTRDRCAAGGRRRALRHRRRRPVVSGPPRGRSRAGRRPASPPSGGSAAPSGDPAPVRPRVPRPRPRSAAAPRPSRTCGPCAPRTPWRPPDAAAAPGDAAPPARSDPPVRPRATWTSTPSAPRGRGSSRSSARTRP